VFAVVRGDLGVSAEKLRRVIGAQSLRPALAEEIRAAGAVPGFASPIGIRDAWVVADESIPGSPNLIAGANQPDLHYRNVNFGRDYAANQVADIALAPDSAACPDCGREYDSMLCVVAAESLAVESAGAFSNVSGNDNPVWSACVEADLFRWLALAAEAHHDDYGVIWPAAIAPFDVAVVSVACDAQASELEARLSAAGFDAMLDDREERAGVKFMTADWIGAPVRITVSEKSLQQGGVEIKVRSALEKRIIPLEQVEEEIRTNIGGRVQ
jgi:prolyl-tRNA synthetase